MAFWSEKRDIIEPIRPFRFTIQESGVNQNAEGSPSDLGIWWWAKSVSKPSFEISQEEYLLINHKIKFPGVATWSDVNLKMIDYKDQMNLAGQTKSFKFYNYLKDSGYSFSGTDGISKKSATTRFVIEQLDADGNPLETWTLINAFIKKVDFVDLSYESEELTEINITIAYDLAELT